VDIKVIGDNHDKSDVFIFCSQRIPLSLRIPEWFNEEERKNLISECKKIYLEVVTRMDADAATKQE
jgi:hypothetical protein